MEKSLKDDMISSRNICAHIPTKSVFRPGKIIVIALVVSVVSVSTVNLR
jgi:hypothetical protein